MKLAGNSIPTGRDSAEHGIECHTDKIGNVVMRKPATPGYEQRPKVILQSLSLIHI